MGTRSKADRPLVPNAVPADLISTVLRPLVDPTSRFLGSPDPFPRTGFAKNCTRDLARFGLGRDHWNDVGFALVAGGGLKTGQVVGATTPRAERAVGRPYTPMHMLATRS